MYLINGVHLHVVDHQPLSISPTIVFDMLCSLQLSILAVETAAMVNTTPLAPAVHAKMVPVLNESLACRAKLQMRRGKDPAHLAADSSAFKMELVYWRSKHQLQMRN